MLAYLRLLVAAGLALITTAGCTSLPPEPVAPRGAAAVNASQARAWDAVIDVFAAKNIPIRNIERASGFIATDPLAVDPRQGLQWADCGKALGLPIGPDRASYNVLVRGDSTRATARVTVRWTQGGRPDDPSLIECTTKGVWEREAEGQIKEAAEKSRGAG